MPSSDDARYKLQETFHGRPIDQHISGWDELWQKSVTPWDRAGPSQALADAITNNTPHQTAAAIIGPPFHQQSSAATNVQQQQQQQQPQRKRALVPGCGRGYDVLLLAALGYDVYGVDGSASALEAARKLQDEVEARISLSSSSSSPSSDDSTSDSNNLLYNPTTTTTTTTTAAGRGSATFILGDFFSDDFLAGTHSAGGSGGGGGGGAHSFHLIFDYTFLCALPRALRPAWAQRMAHLLAPDGHLICLEWPLHKPAREPGPPFGLSPELYEVLLRHPGREVRYDDDDDGKVKVDDDGGGGGDGGGDGGGGGGGGAAVHAAANALVRVERYRPTRTHEAGKDSDFISIWRFREGTTTTTTTTTTLRN